MRHVSTVLRTWRSAALALALVAVPLCAVPSRTVASSSTASQWPMFGQNLNNTASAPSTSIGTGNVGGLTQKWAVTTQGDVSARAAVVNGVAYFPDWGGYIYAVNAGTGTVIWSKNIATDYFGGSLGSKVVARASAVVQGNNLYIGTQTGAYLLDINTKDGSLVWKTQLDTHPLAIDTSSPIVLNNRLYVGVASLEEGAAANPSYPCCSFRGSAVALNVMTGAVLWKTYTVPAGYTGGSVWGSTLVPDPQRNQIYVTTGNNYSTPTAPAYAACIQGGGTEAGCLSPDDHVDSVLALSMNNGSVVWSQRLATSDDWTVACISGFANGQGNCPAGSGPDYDFGSGANLITYQTPSGPHTILGAGQKSGVYSAFDPATGKLLWGTQVGPGSSLGGIEWGSATDGRRIYVAIGNLNHAAYTSPSSLPAGTVGSWSALNPATGGILWQTADPNGAVDLGPMTVANGVVYAPSMGASSASTPNMFALNARSGAPLWSFASGGSVIAGASIANDTVYWGSGYSNLPVPGFVGNNKFYAFTLGGQ